MQPDPTAHYVAAIHNAAWHVRNQRNNEHGRKLRRDALLRMAGVVSCALSEPATDPEPILYAIAVGLFDRSDLRFQN